MCTLSVQLLGGVRALRDGRTAGPFPTHWSAGVAAYLAQARGRLVHRDVVAARFWPDETDDRARTALRRALWGARSVLEPDGIPRGTFLITDGPYVGLADGPAVEVDVARFDHLLGWCSEEGRVNENVSLLEDAVRLYRGDFMDGYDYAWCEAERERLRLAFLSALERLMELHMRRREWRLAIAHGHMILQRDPLREHIHRHLMACYCSQGSRPLAIRQYRECEEVLQEELGIAPMVATQNLFGKIKSGEFVAESEAYQVA